MFDQYALAHQPTRRITRPTVIAGSVGLHLALVAGLWVQARWRIEKLRPDDPEVRFAAAFSPPASSPPAEAPPPERLRPPRRHIVREAVQPTEVAERVETPPETPPGSGGEATESGPIGLDVLAGPACATPPCLPIAAPVPVRPPAAPRLVRNGVLEGHRIAGDPQIGAPESVKLEMRRAGVSRTTGTVKMCLDRAGRVSSVTTLVSTGYPDYDRRLLERMRGWAYRPYQLTSGETIPVCTAITFIFRME